MSSHKRRPRRAGIPWRLLVHEANGERKSHGVQPGRSAHHDANPSEFYIHHELPANTEFDELVVGRWCHIEQMDTGRWWMNIAGVTIWLSADSDGKPKAVTVYGPSFYDEARPGVKYEFAGCENGVTA